MRIDKRALDRLRRQGGPDLVREMIAIFLQDAPARFRAARAGAEAGDLDATRRAAHSLKSTAATLGATQLQAMSGRIEQLASARKAATVAALMSDWESSLSDARDRLTALMQPSPRSR